jgi:hypothetical protein
MTGTCGQVPLSQLQICLFSRDVEGQIFVDVDILICSQRTKLQLQPSDMII